MTDSVHKMLPLIFGAIQGKALSMMAELGIAKLINKNPMSLTELASATGTNPIALERLFCLLEHLGLVSESKENTFVCTELGALLQKDNPESLHHYARLTNSGMVLEMIKDMHVSLETGQSSFKNTHGSSFYEALYQNANIAGLFAGAMQEISGQDIPEILDAYDFSPYKSVVDVGGGQGFLLAAILNKYAEIQGALFELPDVARQAEELLKTYIEDGRGGICEGDFLQGVSAKGDLYILKRVISHYADDDAITLLSNIRENISEGGHLLIIDPDTQSLYGASFNLLMLVAVGGSGVRNMKELDTLFARTGFEFEKNIKLSTELCIVEAKAI